MVWGAEYQIDGLPSALRRKLVHHKYCTDFYRPPNKGCSRPSTAISLPSSPAWWNYLAGRCGWLAQNSGHNRQSRRNFGRTRPIEIMTEPIAKNSCTRDELLRGAYGYCCPSPRVWCMVRYRVIQLRSATSTDRPMPSPIADTPAGGCAGNSCGDPGHTES
jgi:hypothetical protein